MHDLHDAAERLFPQPLLDVLAAQPERTAFEHGARVISYGELLALIRGLVAAMQEVGLGPRTSVALHTGLTVEAFAANIAAHALGCEVVGVRPAWSRPQLAGVLAKGIDAVLGDPSTLAPEVLAVVAGAQRVLSLGSHPGAFDLLDGPSDDPTRPAAKVRPDDIARVTFTSGSSGRPKGCAYTYRTLSLTYQPDRRSADLARLVNQFDRYLAYTSWAIPVRLTFAGRCLLNNGTVVILDDDPIAVMAEAIQQHRITAVVMNVPSLHRLIALLRDEPRDLRCLRAVVVSGSPAGPGLVGAAVDQLGPIVWQGYGQAESGMISLLTPEDIGRDRDAALFSVGRPLPDVEISVRDEAGHMTNAGEIGEICVRGPHVMAHYWKDSEQTSEVLRDGWLHTRDLGRVDSAGLLRLTGRSRDVVIVNGEVCYAGAIEWVLATHPDVEQAYVVGVPDERTGEAVHAFVVLAGVDAPDQADLARLIRAELSAAHVPMSVTVLHEVPTTAAGKPDKQALATLVDAH